MMLRKIKKPRRTRRDKGKKRGPRKHIKRMNKIESLIKKGKNSEAKELMNGK